MEMLQERIPTWPPMEFLAARVRSFGIVGSALVCALVCAPLASLIALAANALWPSSRTDLNSMSFPGMVLLAILIGPLIETCFFQLLIGVAIKSFIDNLAGRLIIISIPFALSHFPIGVASGLSAGVVGGIFFGFLFISWQEISSKKAFAATLLAHGIHNSIILLADHFSGWSG